MTIKPKRQKHDYVDKQKLYEALCEWKKRKDAAEEAGKPAPQLPEYVGEAIILIAENMALRPNFRNYTYLEEMKGDAIVDAVRAMNSFDPFRLGRDGEVNPFGFISLVMWRAFGSRIKRERRIQQTKVDKMLDPLTETYDRDEWSGHDIDNSGMNDFYYENKVT